MELIKKRKRKKKRKKGLVKRLRDREKVVFSATHPRHPFQGNPPGIMLILCVWNALAERDGLYFIRYCLFFRLQTWLGLSDIDSEGNYVWTDGTPTDFTDWADHQPDNYHNVENCIHIRDDTKWNDIHCDKLMNFICKLNPCI